MFLNSIKMMNIYDSFLVKKTVTIRKNVHVSKRLILCNLKKLYTAFKDKHPDLKISFSKSASLRPKWCITVGPKGKHSVCVCTAHQNMKLLLSSVNLSKDYHELLELTVCNRNSKESMIYIAVSPAHVSMQWKLLKADEGWWWWSSWWLWWCSNYFPAVDHKWLGWTDLLHTSTWSIHWTVVWAIRWSNFSFFQWRITISVSKQTKREPEMWWSDYIWRCCRKLLLYSAR